MLNTLLSTRSVLTHFRLQQSWGRSYCHPLEGEAAEPFNNASRASQLLGGTGRSQTTKSCLPGSPGELAKAWRCEMTQNIREFQETTFGRKIGCLLGRQGKQRGGIGADGVASARGCLPTWGVASSNSGACLSPTVFSSARARNMPRQMAEHGNACRCACVRLVMQIILQALAHYSINLCGFSHLTRVSPGPGGLAFSTK